VAVRQERKLDTGQAMSAEPTSAHTADQDPVQHTISFWQKKAGVSLTPVEARGAIDGISGFFQVLAQWYLACPSEGGEKQ
jgi:hypothetical protein